MHDRGSHDPGGVAAEAAGIETPVFIGNGEVDCVGDPRTEPSAYRASSDVTTFVLRRAAHMHNFAGTRAQLWARLDGWARSLSPRAGS